MATNNERQFELLAHGDNLPACPQCGHWNALLDYYNFEEEEDDRHKYFRCRDCGWEVDAYSAVVIVMERDKKEKYYHEVKRVDGDKY